MHPIDSRRGVSHLPMTASLDSSSAPAPRRKKSRMKLIIGLVLVVAVAAVFVALGRKKAPLTPVTVEKVQRKTITQLVSATGKIQPEVEVKIFSEVAGEIIQLPLREGDPVKKGDLLASIRPDNYRFQFEQSQADLASSRATAAQSKVRLDQAKQDLQRNEELYAQQLISDSDITAARSQFQQAQASYESAEANIRRVQGLVNLANDNLRKTTIYAPIDGTISSRSTELGERVEATGQFSGTEMKRVADLANMEVRVNINENDIVNVKVGDKARIAIDAFPGRKFAGEVKEIGSAAKTTGQNTLDEVTNFQVKIRILDRSISLRPGMSASVDVETSTAENVVVVPIQAVTVRAKESNKTVDQLSADRQAKQEAAKGAGDAAAQSEKQKQQAERTDRESLQRVVFAYADGAVKMVPVETGIADLSSMEVKVGLAEGQEIVTGSYSVVARTLTDGMKVRIEEPKDPKAAKKP